MAGDLVNILADLKEKEALALVQERLDSGDDPMAILDDARTAMEVVGKRFEEQTRFDFHGPHQCPPLRHFTVFYQRRR